MNIFQPLNSSEIKLWLCDRIRLQPKIRIYETIVGPVLTYVLQTRIDINNKCWK